jgi:arylsulfatase A-like enzyme
MPQPNIILIMADQFRCDCLGIEGHPDVKTPYLDTLATEGKRFSRAYSSCPTCIAARAALFTGMSQRNHGRVGYEDGVDWDYPVTLAGELGKAGYQTQAVGKMHVHPPRSTLGFHSVDLHDGYLHCYRNADTPHSQHQFLADDYMHWLKERHGAAADFTDTGLECNSWVARPWIYDEMSHPTNWTVSRSIDFLRRRDRRKPFFLFVSFYKPHPPFDAPQCYFDMYNGKELAPPPVGDWADKESYLTEGRVFNSYTSTPDAELQRQSQVGYYACITHLDHQIGRLLMALREDNTRGNTMIVFTSDHGELLGDHNLFRKALPYEGSARIPLIVTMPGSHGGQSNLVSDRVTELRDIMPALLEAAGAEIPDTMDGASFLGDGAAREFLHGEHVFGRRSNHFVVSNRDKYIWFSQTGVEQYFDLENDSQELSDRIHDPDRQARIAVLRQFLVNELTGRPEGYSDGQKLIAGRPTMNTIKEGTP